MKLMSKNKGFTLVELLVVMTIISLLAALIAGNYRNTRYKANDAKRKSDLKQVSNSLELFYSDYGFYPTGNANGEVVGCPYSTTPCTWGTGQFSSGATIYLSAVPKDPTSSQKYYYRVFGSNNQKFQLFAKLENLADQSCIGGNCTSPTGIPSGVTCNGTCNFAITSSNTTATEQ